MNLYDYFLIPLFLLLEIGLLPTLYQLQIKEYLWYRLKAKSKDEGFRMIPWKLPKKSIRNLMMLVIASSLNLATLLLAYYCGCVDAYWKYMVFMLFMIFISKLYLGIAMLATHPLVLYVRNKIVAKAKKKILKHEGLFKIAVTGSYGKTSVKEMLYSVGMHKYNIAKTLENHNSVIGVAMDIVSEVDFDNTVFVCEIGAYRRNEIHEVTEYLKPDVGILTAIGNQHLDLFGSKKELIDTKMELYFDIQPAGRFYINRDMDEKDWEYVEELLAMREDVEVIKYSQKKLVTEMYLSDIEKTEGGFRFKAWLSQTTLDFSVNLEARHDLYNLLPVLDIANVFGDYSHEDLQKSLDILKIGTKRLGVEEIAGNMVMWDVYNSTYHGFMSALDQMKEYDGTKLVITRGILELGDERENSYRNIVERIEDIGAEFITTDKSFGVAATKEKDLVNHVAEFIKKNKKYAILFEGRFAPKTIKLLSEFLDGYRK